MAIGSQFCTALAATSTALATLETIAGAHGVCNKLCRSVSVFPVPVRRVLNAAQLARQRTCCLSGPSPSESVYEHSGEAEQLPASCRQADSMPASALSACLGSRPPPQRMGVQTAQGNVQLWHRAHKGALELPTLHPADARMARAPVVSCHATDPEAQALVARNQPTQPAPWQYVVALATVAIFICYADRSNISVAILEMARQFEWDETFKGTILGIFFLGYAATQLVGGALADRYGGKAVLASGVVAWSVFTFLTPDAAAAGSTTLIACRIAMGLGEVCSHCLVDSVCQLRCPTVPATPVSNVAGVRS